MGQGSQGDGVHRDERGGAADGTAAKHETYSATVQRMLLGQITVDQACTEINDKWSALIAKEKRI